MRFVTLTILFLLAFPCAAEAKYRPLPLDNLLRDSDLVLYGKITSLQDSTFVLTIEQVIAGEYKAKTVTVLRFQDWPCARRWAPYAEDQQLLLCLKRIEDEASGSTLYRIRSGGGEGEMPMVGGNVYVHGPSSVKLQRTEHADVFGAAIRGQKVPLKEIRRLTQILRNKNSGDSEAASGGPPKKQP